jgi:hypothetical protein
VVVGLNPPFSMVVVAKGRAAPKAVVLPRIRSKKRLKMCFMFID